MARGERSFVSSIAEKRMKAIEAALSDKVPRAAPAIGEAVFMDRTSAKRYVEHMHSIGRLYVKKWKTATCPLYLAGKGKDAPKPKVKTSAESSRDYHRRMKNDPEYRMKLQAKDRARRTMPGWTGAKLRHFASTKPQRETLRVSL